MRWRDAKLWLKGLKNLGHIVQRGECPTWRGRGQYPMMPLRGSFEGSNLQIYQYYTSFKMMFFPGSSLYAKYVEFLNQRTLCIWFQGQFQSFHHLVLRQILYTPEFLNILSEFLQFPLQNSRQIAEIGNGTPRKSNKLFFSMRKKVFIIP